MSTAPKPSRLRILVPVMCVAGALAATVFSVSASAKLAEASRLAAEAEQKRVEETSTRDFNEWRVFGVLLEERGPNGQWLRRSTSDLAFNYEVIRSNIEGARAPDLKISWVPREGAVRGLHDRDVSMHCGFRNISTRLTPLNRKEPVGQVINIKCDNADWGMTLTGAQAS